MYLHRDISYSVLSNFFVNNNLFNQAIKGVSIKFCDIGIVFDKVNPLSCISVSLAVLCQMLLIMGNLLHQVLRSGQPHFLWVSFSEVAQRGRSVFCSEVERYFPLLPTSFVGNVVCKAPRRAHIPPLRWYICAHPTSWVKKH